MYKLNSTDTRHNLVAIAAGLAGLVFVIEGLEPLGIAGPTIGLRIAIAVPVFLGLAIWLGLRQVNAWKNLAEALGLQPKDGEGYYGLPPLTGTINRRQVEVNLQHTGEKTQRIYYTVFRVHGRFDQPETQAAWKALQEDGKLSFEDDVLALKTRGYCFEPEDARRILLQMTSLVKASG